MGDFIARIPIPRSDQGKLDWLTKGQLGPGIANVSQAIEQGKQSFVIPKGFRNSASWIHGTPWFQTDLPAVRQGLQSFVIPSGFVSPTITISPPILTAALAIPQVFLFAWRSTPSPINASFGVDGTQCFPTIFVEIYSGARGGEQSFVLGPGFAKPVEFVPYPSWLTRPLAYNVNIYPGIIEGVQAFTTAGFKDPKATNDIFGWVTVNIPAPVLPTTAQTLPALVQSTRSQILGSSFGPAWASFMRIDGTLVRPTTSFRPWWADNSNRLIDRESETTDA